MTVSSSTQLFKISQEQARKIEKKYTPWRRRAYRLALRYGYGREDRTLNFDRLQEAIKSGNAWFHHGVGPRVIEIWCRWVTEEEEPPIKQKNGNSIMREKLEAAL